jgi:GDPmannose 4,6-dehydratase
MKRALICGIGGQDGAFLARFLLEKGYEVFGTSRDAQISSFANLNALKIRDQIKTTSMALKDFRSVLQVLKRVEPQEVYNLSGQSSVELSFDQPVETMESFSVGTLNMLEAIRFLGGATRYYNAGSSECFGDTGGGRANESTAFHPRSIYAVAKCAAHWQVANYREAYKLFACTGILFNHESWLRPERFVTRKIVEAARRIAGGSGEQLVLGNMQVVRDWGWAPEYVEAMWRMLQMDRPDDYVIATGRSVSLEYFVHCVFNEFGLTWREHVKTQPSFYRPTDLETSFADPRKAAEVLGWKAGWAVEDVVRAMSHPPAEPSARPPVSGPAAELIRERPGTGAIRGRLSDLPQGL